MNQFRKENKKFNLNQINLSKITSIEGRVLFNSRGSKTIEVDVKSDNKFLGRVCAPSGASVGKYEATSFPNGGPEESLKI